MYELMCNMCFEIGLYVCDLSDLHEHASVHVHDVGVHYGIDQHLCVLKLSSTHVRTCMLCEFARYVSERTEPYTTSVLLIYTLASASRT